MKGILGELTHAHILHQIDPSCSSPDSSVDIKSLRPLMTKGVKFTLTHFS